MSRIGKKPVDLPTGVSASLSGQTILVKGPKGELSFTATDDVTVKISDSTVVIEPRGSSKRARQQWGMSRTMVSNLVTGVSSGFRKQLEINGVGYRAAVEGRDLVLALGYSHPVRYPIPQGVEMKCERPTAISIYGSDKQQVGQLASEIRAYRPPEPFKGKGIKYANETIRRKEGKKK
jgi:large subunit ribosomal protein L6